MRVVSKESFNAFLNFSHHRGARAESLDSTQISKFCRRGHIDSPDQRRVLVVYLYRPELVQRDHRVDCPARVILQISGLPAVANGPPIGSGQADRGNSIPIEHLP